MRSCYEIDHLPVISHQWQELKGEIFVDGREVTDSKGNTAFMVSAWIGKLDAARALYELGSDPSQINEKGFCVLQSLIRDLPKRPQNIHRVVEIMKCCPHAWRRPEGDETLDAFLDEWLGEFLVCRRLDQWSPQDLGLVIDFILAPLSQSEVSRLSRVHNVIEGSVLDSIEWKSRVADKAARTLSEIAFKSRSKDDLSGSGVQLRF